MKRPIFSPTKFEMYVLGIFHRILKSIYFNIFMIILGFLVGLGTTFFHFHYTAISNSKYEYIVKLESKLRDLDRMDENYDKTQMEIRDIISDIKIKIAHDNSNLNNILTK